MAEAGVLPERPRTELVEGEILEMSSMGVAHAMAITRANRRFSRLFDDSVEVRVQVPLPLSRFSEFEPDLCLVRSDRSALETRHPQPPDVFLVMEISDSSLRYDRDIKLPVYASAEVPEVWIADLPNRILHVFREPAGRVYNVALRLSATDSVSAIAFPEIEIAVSDLVGPART